MAFVEAWVERAEKLLDEDIGAPITALRHALNYADEVHGRVSSTYVGQMLVVIATHWEHGQEMAGGLSSIELRLVQDMLALKFAELQAEAGGDEPYQTDTTWVAPGEIARMMENSDG